MSHGFGPRGPVSNSGLAGIHAPDALVGVTATATAPLGTGRLCWGRFYNDVARLVAGMQFVVSTNATADDAVIIGLSDALGARISKSASTAGKLNNAEATKRRTVLFPAPVQLADETFYIASMLAPTIGGTAPTLWGANFVNVAGYEIEGGAMPHLLGGTMAGQTDIPAQITPDATATTTILPKMYLI